MRFGLRARVLTAAAALAVALVELVTYEASARRSGQQVRLPMQAVDPRSLLSGHYAALNLGYPQAEDADCPLGSAGTSFRDNPNHWVALQPAPDGFHVIAGVASTKTAAAKLGPVQVRGAAVCAGPDLRLDIGVKRFHADQATAQALETELRKPGKQAAAIVSIGRDGRARLVGIVAGDRRIDLPMF